MLLVSMAASYADSWPLDSASVLIELFAFVFMVAVLVLVVHFGLGDIVVYNATEAMVRDVLEESLGEHNLAHSDGDWPGVLSRISGGLNAQTKFSLSLEDLNSSIRVTISPLGSATLRFTRKRSIPDYKGLIASFDRGLQNRMFDGSRFTGCFMLVGSVVLIGGSIWFLLT